MYALTYCVTYLYSLLESLNESLHLSIGTRMIRYIMRVFYTIVLLE